jgi:hypothetical protein
MKPVMNKLTYKEMVIQAILALSPQNRTVVSRIAIRTWIEENFYVNENPNVVKNSLRQAILKLVCEGSIIQVRQSFKLPNKKERLEVIKKYDLNTLKREKARLKRNIQAISADIEKRQKEWSMEVKRLRLVEEQLEDKQDYSPDE